MCKRMCSESKQLGFTYVKKKKSHLKVSHWKIEDLTDLLKGSSCPSTTFGKLDSCRNRYVEET